MNELQFQSKLIAKIRSGLPGSVVFKHSDRLTIGIPDISVSWVGMTSWWELKVASPNIKARGVQTKVIQDLARVTECHYVIFSDDRTYIVIPREIDAWKESPNQTEGINFDFVVAFVLQVHGA